eukprot:scaffold625_cov420-Prasinococcus_capsulatus_cf.AAC.54
MQRHGIPVTRATLPRRMLGLKIDSGLASAMAGACGGKGDRHRPSLGQVASRLGGAVRRVIAVDVPHDGPPRFSVQDKMRPKPHASRRHAMPIITQCRVAIATSQWDFATGVKYA